MRASSGRTDHEIDDDRKSAEWNQLNGDESAEDFRQEIRRHAVEPAGILVPATNTVIR